MASEDLARLSAVRKAVGDGYEIMTDANQGFAVDEAIRRAARLRELDLAWIEEPLPADDIDGHVRLSNSTPTPIAIGESLYSIRHFREYMQKGACSIVQVDVGRIGGITPWLKVAHAAEAFDIPVCPHFLMELHVSLVCAVQNGRYVEYIPQLDELTGKRMRIEDGHALAPEEPGIGIDWDWDAVKAQERRRVHQRRSRQEADMQRMGMVLGLKPEKVDEYVRLHAAVWPDVLTMISACQHQELFDLSEAAGESAVQLFRIPRHRILQPTWPRWRPTRRRRNGGRSACRARSRLPRARRANGGPMMDEVFHHD